MRVLKKMSFDALVENISKEDKKNILGGSGSYGVTNGSYYDANSSMISNSLKQTLGTVSSFYTGLNSTNVQGSSMYTYQQGYLDPGGMGYNSASNYQYYYSNSNSQQKLPTDCVLQCIAYLAAMYGDTSLSFNSIKDIYNSLAIGAISSGVIGNANSGVDGYLLNSITDQFFNRAPGVTNLSQLNSFIKAGGDNFAIGTYSVGNGSSHAVIITGITADGSQYICKDVQNGGRERYLYTSQFNGFVAITGGCH
jgi:hypothetical protein